MKSQPIEKQIFVKCSPDHAFSIFTEKIDLWWPPSHAFLDDATMTMEPLAGGRFFTTNGEDETHLGDVVVWDPPNQLVYTWYPGGGTGPTTVTVDFVAVDLGTDVRVTHREGDAQLGDRWTQHARGFSAAWDDVLPAYAAFAMP